MVGHTPKQMKNGRSCDIQIWWTEAEMSHSYDIFSLGLSYLNVALTTVHRLYSVVQWLCKGPFTRIYVKQLDCFRRLHDFSRPPSFSPVLLSSSFSGLKLWLLPTDHMHSFQSYWNLETRLSRRPCVYPVSIILPLIRAFTRKWSAPHTV